MPFAPATQNPGDLIRAQDWNQAMSEIERLEDDKVNKSGDTISGTLTITGNVGIGTTTTPTDKLHIKAATGNIGLRIESGDGSNDVSAIRFAGNGSQKAWIATRNDTGRLYIGQPGNNDILSVIGGKVGIGETEPDAKLHIDGGSDAGLSSGGYLVIGSVTGSNIAMDNNEIMARNNSAAATLHLQANGGEFHVHGNVSEQALFAIKEDGKVGIGKINPGASFKLDVAGVVHATGFDQTSDARFKKNVAPLSNVLEKLEKLNGVSFEWNELYASLGHTTGRREIGLIAQEVNAVFPELVNTWGDKNYLALDYGRCTAILIEAIKALKSENETLKKRVEELARTWDSREHKNGKLPQGSQTKRDAVMESELA